MNALFEWLIHVPEYFANVGGWLSQPISILGLNLSPLALLGASLGAFLAVVVGLKIKSLVIA